MATENTSIYTADDQLVEYRYKIESVFILIKDESFEIPAERVIKWKIDADYEQATFPVFGINILLESSRYYKIISNRNDVRFKIRFQSYNHDKHTEHDSLMKDCINEEFKLYIEDYNSDYEANLKKEINNSLNKEEDVNELDGLQNEVEFFLFKSYVTGMRSTINTVFNYCNLTTAIAYLLNRAGVKNTLLSPLDNTKVYDSIVIPPLTVDKALRFLNNNFGFHKYGTMIFFDLYRNYIIDYKERCSAWEPDEITNVIICVLDKTENGTYQPGGILKINDNKNYYYNVSSDVITINSKSITSNLITGTDAVSIDSQNSSTENISSNSKVIDSNNTTVLFNDLSNPYMATAYTMMQYSNSTIISLATEGIDIKHFTPNKSFKFIFQDASLNNKYNGVYRLVRSIYSFNKNGDYFLLTAALSFKRIDGFDTNENGES